MKEVLESGPEELEYAVGKCKVATISSQNSGKEFKTSNTPLVSAVMEEIKTTLDERIKDVETQIKF